MIDTNYVVPDHANDPDALVEHLRTSAHSEAYKYRPIQLEKAAMSARSFAQAAVEARGRIKAVARGREPTKAQKADLERFDAAHKEYTALAHRLNQASEERRQAEKVEAKAAIDAGEIEWSDPNSQIRHPMEVNSSTRYVGNGARNPNRDANRRAADAAITEGNRNGLLTDASADLATRLMECGPTTDRSLAARWISATGSPEYLSAFAKIVSDPDKGHMLWTREEQSAYQRANAVGHEMRAASVGNAAQMGYMVPFMLDPVVMLTNDGVRSPLRSLARVEQIVVDRWHGLTSAGATSEWLPELQEAAATTPTVAQPEIPVHKQSTYIEFSVELQGDAVDFVNQLQMIMADSANTHMETAFAVGSGTGQPTGLITALSAVPDSVVAPTTAEQFTAADLYKVQSSLGPRWQPNASWIANLSIINTAAQFETTNGALKFPEIGGGQLLRRPLSECSLMDGTIDPAATANNFVVAYGDWRSAFVIVDRIGATLEIVPHVLGTNRRPIGARGAWLWLRTGSDVVVPQAARLLNIATTA